MIMMNKFLILILLALISCLSLNAKERYDTEGWYGIEIETEIFEDIELEFGQQLRMKEDMEIVKNYITDLGIGWRISDKYKISGFARYKKFPDKAEPSYYFNFYFEEESDPADVEYRLKFDHRFLDGGEYEFFIRNRLEFKFNLFDDLKPFWNSEIFYQAAGTNNRWDKMRITFGLEYEFIKDNEISFYYRYESELFRGTNQIANIIGIYYGLEI